MTINHTDTENPASSPDYSEPDATTMLVDCLCGNVGNELTLNGTSIAEELIYTGVCQGDGCHRALKLFVGSRSQPAS